MKYNTSNGTYIIRIHKHNNKNNKHNNLLSTVIMSAYENVQ